LLAVTLISLEQCLADEVSSQLANISAKLDAINERLQNLELQQQLQQQKQINTATLHNAASEEGRTAVINCSLSINFFAFV
jgi:hypothetical protein